MEEMRKSWTDDRLDDFATNVGRRFDEVGRRIGDLDQRVEKRFDIVDVELHGINDRLDGMSKAIVFGAFTMTAAMSAGFAGMITLVATQT
jgi:hypothetical protein